MFLIFHKFGSPPHLYQFANKWGKYFGIGGLILFVIGSVGGLYLAPPDYQMGDSFRIVYVHAPAAWMSMFIYALMAVCSAGGLIWHLKLGYLAARACAPIGATLTFCALVSGALWGKPTWGTYWVWDARLTSELILLFLFFGCIALDNAFSERRVGARAAAILAVVGVINLPIIHYSVYWWNTLHQGATLIKFGKPSMEIEMLIPLIIMFVAFNLLFFAMWLNRIRYELLDSERRTAWVAKIVGTRREGK